MNRLLVTLFVLVLSGCGLRVGTDPANSDQASQPPLYVATWSRDSADSTWSTRRDTLTLDSLRASALPVADSTILAIRSLDGAWGAWVGPHSRTLTPREPGRPVLRWRDSRHRPGFTFVLPGTGVEVPLDSPNAWGEQTISVFADHWPARIVRSIEGRHVVWSIDSLRLADTLLLDLSALPDSSCPIRPGTVPSLWECLAR